MFRCNNGGNGGGAVKTQTITATKYLAYHQETFLHLGFDELETLYGITNINIPTDYNDLIVPNTMQISGNTLTFAIYNNYSDGGHSVAISITGAGE